MILISSTVGLLNNFFPIFIKDEIFFLDKDTNIHCQEVFAAIMNGNSIYVGNPEVKVITIK